MWYLVWYSDNVWQHKCDTLPSPAHCVVFRCGTLQPAGLQTQDLWQGGAVNHTLFLRTGIFSVPAVPLFSLKCAVRHCVLCRLHLRVGTYNGFQQWLRCAVLCVYFVNSLCSARLLTLYLPRASSSAHCAARILQSSRGTRAEHSPVRGTVRL